jgi:hypothetical protein
MISDYLCIERALSGTLPLNELNTEERHFCDKYRPAFEIGRMAGRMAQGYYAHKAAIEVAKDPRSNSLIPVNARNGHTVPVAMSLVRTGLATFMISTTILTMREPIRTWLMIWNVFGL